MYVSQWQTYIHMFVYIYECMYLCAQMKMNKSCFIPSKGNYSKFTKKKRNQFGDLNKLSFSKEFNLKHYNDIPIKLSFHSSIYVHFSPNPTLLIHFLSKNVCTELYLSLSELTAVTDVRTDALSNRFEAAQRIKIQGFGGKEEQGTGTGRREGVTLLVL